MSGKPVQKGLRLVGLHFLVELGPACTTDQGEVFSAAARLTECEGEGLIGMQ